VIVGVGQVLHRGGLADAREPVDLMADAVRAAVADAGPAGRLLAAVTSVRVVNLLSWRYPDPGRLVAGRLGVDPRTTVVTRPGGQSPQVLLDRTAAAIQAGDLDVAVVCGAEAWRTRMRWRRDGGRPPWTPWDDAAPPPDEVVGDELAMSAPEEQAVGLALPVQVYPLFETALRAAAGRPVADHQAHLGRLWAGFSEVAAGNPWAWLPERRTPEEIATPSPANRMVGFPYPKLMNANNDVDMAAALVLCSAERAGAIGVPKDRWVFLHAGAEANDTAFVSNRGDLRSSPAIRAAGAAALSLAGTGVGDVAHVDLYSCFPSAVQVAAAEIGIGLDRPLTVTGGLSFAGGPWNDYVTHAVASMVGRLREEGPGALGLVTANGGFLTKHAVGVYGSSPPAAGFRWARAQDEADRSPRREVAAGWDGAAAIEAVTVLHDRDGAPETAFVAALTPDGRRTWATTADPGAMGRMTAEEVVGRSATLAGGTVVDIA
jgi:acetyl-CoA C-acetyltransferase